MSIFGTSIRISFISFMNGGKTSNTEARKIKARKIKTKKSDIDLGIFKMLFTLLVRLQIMFAMTREQIISRKKSLRLQNIKKEILKIKILKRTELFKFY